MHWRQTCRETAGWRAALQGEVDGFVSVLQSRKIRDHLDELIAKAEGPQDGFEFPKFSATGKYFEVFYASAQTGKLGLIGRDSARDITKYYMVAASIVEDFNYMAGISGSSHESISKLQAVAEMKNLRNALTDLFELKEKISTDP